MNRELDRLISTSFKDITLSFIDLNYGDKKVYWQNI